MYFDKKKVKSDFNKEDAYRKLPLNHLQNIHASLIKLLSDFPAFYTGQGNFKDKYSDKLGRVVKSMQRIVQGKELVSKHWYENEHDKKVDRRDEQQILIDEKYKT